MYSSSLVGSSSLPPLVKMAPTGWKRGRKVKEQIWACRRGAQKNRTEPPNKRGYQSNVIRSFLSGLLPLRLFLSATNNLFSCQNAFSSSCAGVNGVRLISCLIAPFLCYFHNPLLTSPQKKLRHDCCYGAPSSHNSPTKKECGLQKEAF